ncbi:MAG TPA: hypothetical protein DCE42_12100 [Myxococcales bacterium]|nr:hypothetical protein [Deltaproteobacteria bacterium]MBU53397.1 hypothetical protein [Deltaproteobacteria bacterium]HAA55493.1 hypothetical protein [Myxococcales bacterium]
MLSSFFVSVHLMKMCTYKPRCVHRLMKYTVFFQKCGSIFHRQYKNVACTKELTPCEDKAKKSREAKETGGM